MSPEPIALPDFAAPPLRSRFNGAANYAFGGVTAVVTSIFTLAWINDIAGPAGYLATMSPVAIAAAIGLGTLLGTGFGMRMIMEWGKRTNDSDETPKWDMRPAFIGGALSALFMSGLATGYQLRETAPAPLKTGALETSSATPAPQNLLPEKMTLQFKPA